MILIEPSKFRFDDGPVLYKILKKFMQTLTIAIPTFNRAEKIEQRIRFLFEVFSNSDLPIKLIISDNCSEDITEEICKNWSLLFKQKSIDFKYLRNTTNVGAVKNVIQCIETAETDLVWVMGDDDVLIKENLLKLFDILKNSEEDYAIYHLNYSIADGRDNTIIKDLNYEKLSSESSYHSCLSSTMQIDAFMFITANILSKKVAINAINSWKRGKALLAYPLYINLYASVYGPFKLIDFPVFIGTYHAGSWAEHFGIVYKIEVPLVLGKLLHFKDIDNDLIIKIIKKLTSLFRVTKMIIKKPNLLWYIFKSI